MEWVAQAWAQMDMLHRAALVASALLFLWAVQPALTPSGERGPAASTGGVSMGKTTIINNGGMQIGGQGNTQNNTFVNTAARYESQARVEQQRDGDGYVTKVHFGITPNRPWSASVRSTIAVRLSGPYESYDVAGFGWAQMNVVTQENKEQGVLSYSTATAPTDNEVVVTFRTKDSVRVVATAADPVEP